MQYIFMVIFNCRHLAQRLIVKITAGASQSTTKINTIVFVSLAIQVFIAWRKVNEALDKTSTFSDSHDVV